jgi:hypothetical protein
MHECANCGYQNRAGVVFCDNCGASLIGKLPISTKALDTGSGVQADAGGEAGVVRTDLIQGMATFVMGDSLKLDIEGAVKPMVLQPKSETILGRRDPATGVAPDIDLTPHAGYRMGVSRRHAAIRYGDDNTLNVWDLGSSNGTFLNGQRLSAHRPYRLHDGDELRLGQMVIRLYFRSGKAVPALDEVPATSPEPVAASGPAQGPKAPAEEKPRPQPESLAAVLTPPPFATAAALPKASGSEAPPAVSGAAQSQEPAAVSGPEPKAVPEPASATTAPEMPLPTAAGTPAGQPAAPPAIPQPASADSPVEKPPAARPEAPPTPEETPAQQPSAPKPEAPPAVAADAPVEQPSPARSETPPAAAAPPQAEQVKPGSEPPRSSEQTADKSGQGKNDARP